MEQFLVVNKMFTDSGLPALPVPPALLQDNKLYGEYDVHGIANYQSLPPAPTTPPMLPGLWNNTLPPAPTMTTPALPPAPTNPPLLPGLWNNTWTPAPTMTTPAPCPIDAVPGRLPVPLPPFQPVTPIPAPYPEHSVKKEESVTLPIQPQQPCSYSYHQQPLHQQQQQQQQQYEMGGQPKVDIRSPDGDGGVEIFG